MNDHVQAKEEVRAFEHNAKEGVRLVAFQWFLRRVALPLSLFILVCIGAAFANGGLVAGTLSALFFAVPAFLLWLLTADQGLKLLRYWIK